MELNSINDLEKWFYKNKREIVQFQFELTNCLYLIMEDYQQGFTVFCDKIKNKYSLYKMQSAFEKEKKNSLERLFV